MTAWRRFAQALRRGPGSEPAPAPPGEIVSALAARLDAAAQRRLGRSLALRHVDGGSCNACELELQALQGVLYDLERFGLRFVASPRHADVLVVTGPLTRNLREALGERSVESVADMVLGLADRDRQPLRLTLRIRPTFITGSGRRIAPAGYITVDKEFTAGQVLDAVDRRDSLKRRP